MQVASVQAKMGQKLYRNPEFKIRLSVDCSGIGTYIERYNIVTFIFYPTQKRAKKTVMESFLLRQIQSDNSSWTCSLTAILKFPSLQKVFSILLSYQKRAILASIEPIIKVLYRNITSRTIRPRHLSFARSPCKYSIGSFIKASIAIIFRPSIIVSHFIHLFFIEKIFP